MTCAPASSGRETAPHWTRSHRFDTRALPLADRHYNRRKVGSPQFVPPGRCVVLLTPVADALWVTSWPFAQYVRHAWPGAWVNSLFRNEGSGVASDLIRAAVAATRSIFGEPPELGMVTFINPKFVAPMKRRGEDVFGYSYRRAGFVDATPPRTKAGLIALQLLPSDMPQPCAPVGQASLFDEPRAVSPSGAVAAACPTHEENR